MNARPASNSAGSPWNLLTSVAPISAASAGSMTAKVPARAAMTPPRWMSPTSTTGMSAARAKPKLAMSLARRFTSEALPAPSTRTRSAVGSELGMGGQHLGQQLAALPPVVTRRERADAAAADDELGAALVLGLQQHRVHGGDRVAPRGAGLQRLGPPDLAAIGGDGGVVRHVLRLERRDAQAAIGEGAAKPRHQQRLADVGTGAHEHEGSGGHEGS